MMDEGRTGGVLIPPSMTVHFHGLAQALRARGERVVDLTAGEAKLPTHPRVCEGVAEALAAERAYYAPVMGLPALREAAAGWMQETYGCRVGVPETLVTAGGKFGIFLLLQALLSPGDGVLVCAPYWVTYPSLVRFWGGEVQEVVGDATRDFRVSAATLEAAITPATRGLILNNAANPTGALYTRDELTAILEVAARHQLWVLADEVYSGLVYEGEFFSCGALAADDQPVFVVQSCSKSFGMTGWRVGFVFGQASMISRIAHLQGQSITSASIVSQWAASCAFSHAAEIAEYVRSEMLSRRDLFARSFTEVFGHEVAGTCPASALYAFVPLRALGEKVAQEASFAFCERALKEANLATVPGDAFGMEGYIRCSFAGAPDDITDGIQRLHKLCS